MELFCMRMLPRTFILRDEKKAPGFKASKDILLPDDNLEGNMLVCYSKNP
jgi:hypothetical protein